MTRFREIPSLVHSSATQQISFSIMAIITFTLLTFFYLHTPFLFTTLCIFQYLFCIQISKTQFKSLCIYFPGEDIYFTSGVQSIIIIYKTSFVQLNSTSRIVLVLSAACSFHHCCCCQLGSKPVFTHECLSKIGLVTLK